MSLRRFRTSKTERVSDAGRARLPASSRALMKNRAVLQAEADAFRARFQLPFTARLGSAASPIPPSVCLLCLLPPHTSSFSSTGSSHLLDTLVRPCPARSQTRYLLGSQPLSSPAAGPSAMPGTAHTSLGFKSVSTTRMAAQHSRTSVFAIPFRSARGVYWQAADGATCFTSVTP